MNTVTPPACVHRRCHSAPCGDDVGFMDSVQSRRQRQAAAQHAEEQDSVAVVTASAVPVCVCIAPAGGTVRGSIVAGVGQMEAHAAHFI